MPTKFICTCCNELVDCNIRLKGQQEYCGKPKCQRERKRRWQRHKMKTDPVYRKRQHQCQQKWRANRPLHQYQKLYREQHPDYVKTNRQQQRTRNRQRKQPIQAFFPEKIVKMDAFNESSIKSNVYVMKTYTTDVEQKIVKMDTLIVQLLPYQTVGSQYLQPG
jgi:hypothetical protein